MSTLSIILPTLNSEATLSRAIESILHQSFNNWEMLIMDGGSSDNTLAIAESYYDSRIIIHTAHDLGIYDAMNHGIKLSNGEWLYFLGSDDYLTGTNALEQMLKNTEGLDMVYGEVQATHLPPEHFGEWNADTLPYNRCHQAIFYRRTIFEKIGPYPLQYPICADHYINLRAFLDHRFHLQYRSIDVAFHSAGGTSSNKSDLAFYNDLDRLIVRYGLLTLPKQLLAKHCRAALSHHCTRPQRASLMLLQTWLRIIS